MSTMNIDVDDVLAEPKKGINMTAEITRDAAPLFAKYGRARGFGGYEFARVLIRIDDFVAIDGTTGRHDLSPTIVAEIFATYNQGNPPPAQRLGVIRVEVDISDLVGRENATGRAHARVLERLEAKVHELLKGDAA